MNYEVGELKRSSGNYGWIVKITAVTDGTVSYETIQYPWSDTMKPSNTFTKDQFHDLFRHYNSTDISVYGKPKPYKNLAERESYMDELFANSVEVDQEELARQMAHDAISDKETGF